MSNMYDADICARSILCVCASNIRTDSYYTYVFSLLYMEVKITVRFTEISVILTNALYMESCPSGRRSTIGNRVGA